MPDELDRQWIQGNQNVQISNVAGSTINLTLKDSERSWHVALEPATASVGLDVKSPARLVRARSGILPYVDRAGHLAALSEWIGTPVPFALCIVGGRGGTGKTRLGVELCERTVARAGWLSGLLPREGNDAGLRDLYDAPNPRLVVIDYAETRIEQLEIVLPELQRAASGQYPIRVLLLIRAAPLHSSDWTEALRGGSDWLESVLDQATVRILDETPPTPSDRRALFDAASAAFAQRANRAVSLTDVAVPDLTGKTFTTPLLIVIAAYLAVHPSGDPPNPFPKLPPAPPDLLERLTKHEAEYWNSRAKELGIEGTLQRRVVALATLAGAGAGVKAEAEAEAALILGQLPDFAGESAERRHSVARWAHSLYPGPYWWNPLEPDLLGEYLVSSTLAGFPQVLAAVLDREHPESLIQPLETYARIAASDNKFADAARPVLSSNLARLCRIAAEQVAEGRDLALLLGGTSVAGALERAASVIAPDPNALSAAVEALPSRPNAILDGLALTLLEQVVHVQRELVATDPLAHKHDLATSLSALSPLLARVGRLEEALRAMEDVLELRFPTADDMAANQADLARTLNDLSTRLAGVGLVDDALEVIEEAVRIRQWLAEEDPSLHDPGLAESLNGLANRLWQSGRNSDALAPLKTSVRVHRRLVAENPAAYERGLALVLGNLANLLGELDLPDEALAAAQESADLYQRLADANPAAHEAELAQALNILGLCQMGVQQFDDALASIQKSAAISRGLAAFRPAAYERLLASVLTNLANALGNARRGAEALQTLAEAADVYLRLVNWPIDEVSTVASALTQMADISAQGGQPDVAVILEEKAVQIYQKLAADDPANYELSLAAALHSLAYCLAQTEQPDRAVAPGEEAVRLFRKAAAANNLRLDVLALALGTWTDVLALTGQPDKAVIPGEEAVQIYRKLAAADPATHEPVFAMALTALALVIAQTEQSNKAVIPGEEAVQIYRKLAAADPATHERDLAFALGVLAGLPGATESPSQ
ncbi:tetratricopeptide repeat protein [Pseudarthrobacter sulfonivorans]|uniref:tetratricopeptide repeat protein n=1 Tax=Pseudarthrobacter sulfonivorans TaxID=121292 RepID=UPI00277F7822|nr:tetratricopeptide repeat protein [Pseudarthrobacter sulfonivorans]MDQ0000145.1 tetratricopeptide (TPR) repeat protein [Pseudarthrobacter sulfonivorans]